MLLDTQLQLDNAHAYTATAISTNVWDTGPVTINTTATSAPASRSCSRS
jgi:hypothetical protein